MFKYACTVALNRAVPPPFLFLPPSTPLSILVRLYFLFLSVSLNLVHKYVHSSLKCDWIKIIFNKFFVFLLNRKSNNFISSGHQGSMNHPEG